VKVQVWRSGGLLGRRVEWDVIVDEQPDPEQWYVLIAELPWHEHPATSTMPDRYTYEIRCEPHEAVIPEQQLVGPWRELVDRVRDAQSSNERESLPESECEAEVPLAAKTERGPDRQDDER
tara:strand:+ start:119509 stop:119871 length:363 start_codon:yes stop_codon:yes gene_type:complete